MSVPFMPAAMPTGNVLHAATGKTAFIPVMERLANIRLFRWALPGKTAWIAMTETNV